MGGTQCCDRPESQEDNQMILEKYRYSKRVSHINDLLINSDVIINKLQGTPLENYFIKKLLGEGSFGRVYLVMHKDTKLSRALKHIELDEQLNYKYVENEVNILKKLDYPSIIKIYEVYCTDPKNFYLVTEYCEGGELFEKINSNYQFTESHIKHITYQLLLSIYYCHLNKIVHRDLKPENILIENIDQNGNFIVKVIDFGTAKIFKNSNLKVIKGSIYYLAPEVIQKNYNEKVDLWSLGVILYILMYLKQPFRGKNDEEIAREILKKEPEIPKNKNYTIEAKSILLSLLQKNPDNRLSAMEALNHPWFNDIRGEFAMKNNDKMHVFIDNLKSYKMNYKLQQAAIAVIVHNLPHSEEVRDLEKAFRVIDVNGDGKLSKNELINGFVDLLMKSEEEATNEVTRIFKQVDADKNQFIQYEEFIRACIDKEKLLNNKYLKYAFNFFDIDGSGQITCNEIAEVFGSGNQVVDKKIVEKIIREVDLDGDGQVSFSEFKTMMEQILN